jgi:2-methylcitrate dehydratase PrpD
MCSESSDAGESGGADFGGDSGGDAAGRLGAWAAGLDAGALPADVARAARRSLTDVVGVALAGSRHPTVARVAGHAARGFAAGPCRVVAPDVSGLSPPGAALVNATAAHVLDFDDTCFDGIVHGSAAVWPAVAAAAEAAGGSGADLLAGFVAGVEVEYALGRALGDALYFRGW